MASSTPSVFLSDPDVTLWHGDVLETLRELPAESVDCVVTSPPYWGLRDYGQEGQLGLEPTPEQYVERMVEVFREIRRVLAAHGTVWLNLGDSYAGNAVHVGRRDRDSLVQYDVGRGYVSDAESSQQVRPPRGADRPMPPGLKQKDLVGIPWRVAFALQQPYYAGRIKDVNDRFWLAAMVDAEGCIHVHRRKAGTSAHSTFEKADGTVSEYVRKQDTYGVMVSIDNTSKAVIKRCHAIIGQGSLYTQEAGTGKQQRKRTIHRLTLTGNQARELLRELYPYLVAKQHEAGIAYYAPSNGPEAEAAHEAIKALHNGRDTTVYRPAPPTLFEPGWYLRSDVIWGKPNPMPESVTDRPTKAHEYVFLLSKQPRYFFDQEAVREPHMFPNQSRTWPAGALRQATQPGNTLQVRPDHEPKNHPNGRNIRSVWEIATQPYPEAHFATFPEELARRAIAAGTSERGKCPECGAPWVRKVEQPSYPRDATSHRGRSDWADGSGRNDGDITRSGQEFNRWRAGNPGTTTWVRTCASSCVNGDKFRTANPCVVLDPFVGSGTVCYVARKLGRHSIGIDLSAEYLALAARRLQQQSLFAEAAS